MSNRATVSRLSVALLLFLPLIGCTEPDAAAMAADTTDTGESTGPTPNDEGAASEDTASPTEETGSTSGSSRACEEDAECTDGDARFCVAGHCVSCGSISDADAACASVDPKTPLCEQGVCVACTEEAAWVCDGNRPVCDTATNSCVPCTEHSQCGAVGCHIEEGRCLEGGTSYVSNEVELNLALIGIGYGGEGTIVLTRDSDEPYEGQWTLPENSTVAFLRGASVQPQLSSNGAILRVPSGTIAYVEGLQLVSAPTAVVVAGGRAYLSRSAVGGFGSDQLISVSEGGMLNLVNTRLSSGYSHGIIINGGNLQMLYSSLRSTDLYGEAGIRCAAGDSVTIRNSMVLLQGSESENTQIECEDTSMSYSLTTDTFHQGPGNKVVDFDSGTAGYLDAEGLTDLGEELAAGVARWELGDPKTDMHGRARPSSPGAADYAGPYLPHD